MLSHGDTAGLESLKAQISFSRICYITSNESHQTFLQNYSQILCFKQLFCYMKGLFLKSEPGMLE